MSVVVGTVRRMVGDSQAWAHSINGRGDRHLLRDHLVGTARLARGFGAAFGAADLVGALGLLHDAGKVDCAWQAGLVRAEATGGPVGSDHKRLGAHLLRSSVGPGVAAVLGHHGGLLDFNEVKAALASVDEDDAARDRLMVAVPEVAAFLTRHEVLWPTTWHGPALEMGLRLAYSALVDADFLDTAAHFAGWPAPSVSAPADMAALVSRFEDRRSQLLLGRPGSPIDGRRDQVYAAAVAAAAGRPGIFRLPAPTGSGKTLAAAGFALHHAARYGKARVIVAVPFISITEQNAAVCRALLGEDVVLEHHSSIDPDVRRAKLGVDNWDAPFVVTTTVQLFDSLFGRKPARSRKVHRLANAVIVLDEVQALPIALLPTILGGLRTLTEHFGATVLLSSATQPSFQTLGAWRDIGGSITEVVDDPVELYDSLRRVEFRWWLEPRPTFEEVAQAVAGHEQALVVVNTVADARRLARNIAERVPAGRVLHLSTRMCPAHRRAVLGTTCDRLAGGGPVVLVATQLIEAGVDVDFPVVYRALAPADSLLQAAGRANREGRGNTPGSVVVFDAEGAGNPPSYRTPVAMTRRFFGPGLADPDEIGALARYYPALYHAVNVDEGPRATAIERNRKQLFFRSVVDGPIVDAATGRRDPAKAFRMLDDDGVSVVVTSYQDGGRVADLLTALRSGADPGAHALRRLQPFTVSLPSWVAARPDVAALLRPVVEGVWEWAGEYDDDVGIDDQATVGDTVW